MTDNLLTKGIITMNFLEERIMKDGVVKEGNILKVDSFLNHQMDVKLFKQMGEEFKRRFAGKNINKIITYMTGFMVTLVYLEIIRYKTDFESFGIFIYLFISMMFSIVMLGGTIAEKAF